MKAIRVHQFGDASALHYEDTPMPEPKSEKIAVIGLGYVGLPVALAFSRKYPTIGYDIKRRRVDMLSSGRDDTGEVSERELRQSKLRFTT